ncbi:hypothetical protein VQ056_04380 [Paenibacillus sp. JTLBN-2024]
MTAPGITRDELALIKSYLLLQYIHKVFERDLRIMEESGVFKTPELYMEVVAGGDRQSYTLLSGVKREFKAPNPRIPHPSRRTRHRRGICMQGLHGRNEHFMAGFPQRNDGPHEGLSGTRSECRHRLFSGQPSFPSCFDDVRIPMSCPRAGSPG